MMRALFLICAAGAISSCSATGPAQPEQPGTSAATVYMAALETLCNGEAYTGKLVSTGGDDGSFSTEPVSMGPAVCSSDTVRIPLTVGTNRSRTWVVTRTDTGVRLKHDHRHKDGSESTVTQYGGDSLSAGSEVRQEFPADAASKALFTHEGMDVSNQNTWAIEIRPGTEFVYELWRPDRHFRLEFDLAAPVAPPPPPWGLEPVE